MEDRWKEYGLFSGILAGIVFIIGSVIAMITYPNYSLTANFFSDTGLRIDQNSVFDGRLIMAHPYPYIFNITLYITGLLLLPFFAVFPMTMNDHKNTSPISRISYWICTTMGLVMVPAVISVGIWDWGTNFTAHVIAAQTTMGTILFFMLFWIIGDYYLNEEHPYKPKSQFKLDIGVGIWIIFFTYPLVGFPFPLIITQIIPLQVFQKTSIYSALLYVAVIAVRLTSLYKIQDKM